MLLIKSIRLNYEQYIFGDNVLKECYIKILFKKKPNETKIMVERKKMYKYILSIFRMMCDNKMRSMTKQ